MNQTTEAEDYARSLPQAVRPIPGVLIEALHSLDEKIAALYVEISRRAEEDEDARRLKTIPGVGPVTAAATSALAPPAQTFARGRDFAAWLGLTPLQRQAETWRDLKKGRAHNAQSSARALSCVGLREREHLQDHGSNARLLASHVCLLRWPEPTRWHVLSGPR
jgi:transposase